MREIRIRFHLNQKTKNVKFDGWIQGRKHIGAIPHRCMIVNYESLSDEVKHNPVLMLGFDVSKSIVCMTSPDITTVKAPKTLGKFLVVNELIIDGQKNPHWFTYENKLPSQIDRIKVLRMPDDTILTIVKHDNRSERWFNELRVYDDISGVKSQAKVMLRSRAARVGFKVKPTATKIHYYVRDTTVPISMNRISEIRSMDIPKEKVECSICLEPRNCSYEICETCFGAVCLSCHRKTDGHCPLCRGGYEDDGWHGSFTYTVEHDIVDLTKPNKRQKIEE